MSVATTRNAAVFGATFGNVRRFDETIVTRCPGGAERRTMSARQVVVCADVPRLHDLPASPSVR